MPPQRSSVAGFLLEKEIEYLGNAVENPVRPFVAILGGAKVSDKLAVVNNLLTKVNTLIIGGGMAYTFLKAQGHSVGNSLCELDQLDYAKDMIAKAKELGVSFLLPVDNVAADKAHSVSVRRLPKSRRTAESPSSAAATLSRRSTRAALPTRCLTFPPAAALPSNTSKANSSRVLWL